MKYLDASWFLEMIESESATDNDVMPLIGFYYCWCACNELLSQQEVDFQKSNIELAKDKKILPLDLSKRIDTKLVAEQFTQKGQKFSSVYLEKKYFTDFVNAFNVDTLESHVFNVPNSWNNFKKIAKLINKNYNDWQLGKDINKPWWKFWK